MALYPEAIQKPLNKRTSLMSAYDYLCLHTMVGYLYSTDSYFRTASTDSHFGIGGAWGSDVSRNLDGVVYQWDDTRYRSAANLNGNGNVISVETADNAPASASDILPWTEKQQDAIVDLMVWAHNTHDIPLVLVPDTKPGRRGIAYHRQGIPPYLVSGGVQWSSATGKVCPGDRRIAQIPGLIERARAKVAGVATEELDIIMAYYASKADYETAIKNLVDDRLKATGYRLFLAALTGNANTAFPDATQFDNWNLKDQLSGIYSIMTFGDNADDTKDPGTHPNNAQNIRKELATLAANVAAQNAALLAAVQALTTVPGTPASELGLDETKLQEMMNVAAKNAVDSINLDIVRVADTNG